jgi:hypothetical protein
VKGELPYRKKPIRETPSQRENNVASTALGRK